VGGLTKALSPIIQEKLTSALTNAFGESELTDWFIVHSTFYVKGADLNPLSVFVLHAPKRSDLLLHQNVPSGRGRWPTMDTDYQRTRGGHYRVWQQSRFMKGPSMLPPGPCPRHLWEEVSKRGQPVAWTEPQDDQGGFRVLVPHLEEGGDCHYVSALRADVLDYAIVAEASARRFEPTSANDSG
jgi:hypothetical protein